MKNKRFIFVARLTIRNLVGVLHVCFLKPNDMAICLATKHGRSAIGSHDTYLSNRKQGAKSPIVSQEVRAHKSLAQITPPTPTRRHNEIVLLTGPLANEIPYYI